MVILIRRKKGTLQKQFFKMIIKNPVKAGFYFVRLSRLLFQ